jgi:hypothetical protein
MADVQLKWFGDQISARLKSELTKRIYTSCIVLSNAAKQSLGQPFPPSSSPGQPPHRRTGRLRASVAYEVDGMTGRVGTNVQYGRWLELGTSRVDARPWLRPALMSSRQKIERILGAPIL